MTGIEKIKKHPQVESISDERDTDEGIWVYLKKGYVSNLECGIIHEHTITRCLTELKSITKND